MKKLKVLFVCTANRYRSRTAHELFENDDRLDVKSCGLMKFYVNDTIKHYWDRAQHFSKELYEWADKVYIMETYHNNEIMSRNKTNNWNLDKSKLINLEIDDVYEYNDPELIGLLKQKVKLEENNE